VNPSRIAAAVLLASSAGCAQPEDPVAAAVRARDFTALAAVADGADEGAACRAAKAVVWARGPDLAPLHLRFLGYARCGWELRAEAAWRLTEELTAETRAGAVGPLAALLTDPDEKIRWNAARALGLLGAPESAASLKTCASDANKFVAAWCRWSTCKVTGGADCKRPNMDLLNGEPAP
jgi:hypothetical protein